MSNTIITKDLANAIFSNVLLMLDYVGYNHLEVALYNNDVAITYDGYKTQRAYMNNTVDNVIANNKELVFPEVPVGVADFTVTHLWFIPSTYGSNPTLGNVWIKHELNTPITVKAGDTIKIPVNALTLSIS